METITITERKSLDIALDKIETSPTNGIFRRPAEITDEALRELASSIEQYGVIQSILVRPHPEKEGHYQLICGERRYRASLLAGRATIPAQVTEATDEKAVEMQAIENIERENIHPLNECKGYRIMLENNKNLTVADLAQRFSKSETYILQRLKLHDLVREFKKDFYEDRILLGHATILARLTPADQREARERLSRRDEVLGTVKDLQEFVDSNIMNSLGSAPFDKADSTLVPKAGPCVTCPKRSGASPLLFADIKDKDTCADRGCFFTKCRKFLARKTREIIDTQPDVVFLTDWTQPEDEILTMLSEHRLTPLREHGDFYKSDTGGSKVKGLWISGPRTGHMATVFLPKQSKPKPTNEKEARREQVEKIKTRISRGKELDREKVYAKILEALHNHASQKKGFDRRMMPDEEILLWFIIFDKAGFNTTRELARFLGVSEKREPEKIYAALRALKPEGKAFLLRKVMMDQYGGNYPDSPYGYIIYKIAAAYGDIDIAGFEKDQSEICSKREERAKERIKELRR